jgi:peptide/nickel transport system ATP-binding protein
VGESGSGKSLTALAVLGLLPPPLRVSSGSIRFDGVELTRLSPRQYRALRGRRIAIVFQDPVASLNPAFSVEAQLVEVIQQHARLRPARARARAVELLERVGIPEPQRRIRDYPHQYSGGMAQRVMIALAIACEPRLLIADEPTTALDVTIQSQILALVQSLCDELSMSLLLISHDLSVIAEMADSVAVLYAGQVVESGPVERVLASPTHPYTSALFAAHPESSGRGERLKAIPGAVPEPASPPSGCRFHPRCLHAIPACAQEVPSLVGERDRGVRCLRWRELALPGFRLAAERRARALRASAVDQPLLRARGLTREIALGGFFRPRGSGLLAVDDVDLEIASGETLGLVGESGAGKSTVARLLAGLVDPTRGRIEFQGMDVLALGRCARRELTRQIQLVFQNPASTLDPRMTAGQSIAEPLEVHVRPTRAEKERRVAEVLEQVGLDAGYARRYPQELSGGQKQRVSIARALVLQPRLIVCDEPLSSLDASTQAQVVNLLLELQQRLGVAYLFIGHDLAVVHHLSDRIAVMFRGQVVEVGPSDQVRFEPRHPYTRRLVSAVLSPDPGHRRLASRVPGAAAAIPEPIAGCRFAPLCPHVSPRCLDEMPRLIPTDVGAFVRCHLFDSSVAFPPLDTQDSLHPGDPKLPE